MHATRQQRARLEQIVRRADFVFIQSKGRKWVSQGLIVQVSENPNTPADKIRIGFTVSKKVSKLAVKRNRVKRRLRAVAADVLSLHGKGGHDYVLVGRIETLDRPYATLCKDLKWCLRKMELYIEQPENAKKADA